MSARRTAMATSLSVAMAIATTQAHAEDAKCTTSAASSAGEATGAERAAKLAEKHLALEDLRARAAAVRTAADAAATAQLSATEIAEKRGAADRLADELACAEYEAASLAAYDAHAGSGGFHGLLAGSLAGGAAGVSRLGASVLVSHRPLGFAEAEVGIGVDALREVALDRERVDGDERDRHVPVVGLRSRFDFSPSAVAFFLGVMPDLVIRPGGDWNGRPGGVRPSLAAQIGARLRIGGNEASPIAGTLRIFAEPRVTMDGETPTAVLFGFEVAFGVLLNRSDAKRVEYRWSQPGR